MPYISLKKLFQIIQERKSLINEIIDKYGSEIESLKNVFERRVTIDYRCTLPLLSIFINRKELPRNISIIPLALSKSDNNIYLLYIVIVEKYSGEDS